MRAVAKGFTSFDVEDSRVVEDTTGLMEVLGAFEDSAEGFLNATYMVELVCEVLTDGSEKRSIRIRLAERV